MEGIPVSEIAVRLGISSSAVKMRFSRRGIKPFKYIGSAGLYTESDIAEIKDAGIGRQFAKKNDNNKE